MSGIMVKMSLGTSASLIRVPGFEFRLYSQFQVPASEHPGLQLAAGSLAHVGDSDQVPS